MKQKDLPTCLRISSHWFYYLYYYVLFPRPEKWDRKEWLEKQKKPVE